MRVQSGDGTHTTYASGSCGGPSMIEEDNEGDSVRDYTVMRCDWPEEAAFWITPSFSEYWAFHTGDDSEVPSCVYIGTQINGQWTDQKCAGNDYDERKATEVGRVENLLPDEVVRLCRKWLEGK